MKTCVAALLLYLLLMCGGACLAQPAYPEPEAAAAWRGLAAGYVRQALKDGSLNRDPQLNARVDAAMAAVGAAVAAFDPRFAGASWKAILIEDFGRGAVAFPGEIILVDAKFVRALRLNDDELALILAHEAAHVVAGHASEKLSFMAEYLGKDRLPNARSALMEFFAKDTYAAVFQPTALRQEREADRVGAVIFFATGYDAPRALGVFDKLAGLETRRDQDSHDAAGVRKLAISAVFAEQRLLQARRSIAGP